MHFTKRKHISQYTSLISIPFLFGTHLWISSCIDTSFGEGSSKLGFFFPLLLELFLQSYSWKPTCLAIVWIRSSRFYGTCGNWASIHSSVRSLHISCELGGNMGSGDQSIRRKARKMRLWRKEKEDGSADTEWELWIRTQRPHYY